MALRNHLSTRLPDYMVPSAFVRLDAFPFTSNGKIDHRALPKPSEDSFAHEEYEEPQGRSIRHSEIETALASIWADLLRLDRVSRNDSFFALGGHSLMAVQMMSRVASLGARVPLATLFASPCLAEFAVEIKSRLGEDSVVHPPIISVPRQEMMPLSFAQQRMWFLAQMDGVSDTNHVPLTIRLRGALNRDAWQRAMDDLFTRHEALRTIFMAVDGEPYMKLLAPQVPGLHRLAKTVLFRERLKNQSEYWRKTLAGVPVMIELPTDRPRPSHQSFAGARIPIALDADLTSFRKRLSQEHGVTLFMTILTAWSVVLSRLSSQDDIVIGYPSANRGCH
ncbi:unnamed protein product [Mortierella alpina]